MSDKPLPSKARGLSLLSGGLDSILAVCVLREQGCHVEGITFTSPFFGADAARRAADQLGIALHVVDFTEDITDLVAHPPHGFGGAMNPCIDCHARMIQRAGERVRDLGWDFVSTGEVLNQRPMSQNARSLEIVLESSGFSDFLVRPLSAQLLPPSRPEREGRIDRSRLLALNGRSRQPQKALAEHFGLVEIPSSGGGCRLTEKLYAAKVRDLRDHGLLKSPAELAMLALGRHFRLPGGAKCVVGRDAAENAKLAALAASAGYVALEAVVVPGPVTLVSASATAEDLATATELCAGYADASAGKVAVRQTAPDGAVADVECDPMPRERARSWMLQ